MITFFLATFGFVLPLFAEPLNQETLDRMITSLSLSRHPGDIDLKVLVTSIDPQPVPYLKEIIENRPVRVYVKVNAVNALAKFELTESKSYLETHLSDPNQHRLVRQSVIQSYIQKYYDKDPNAAVFKLRTSIKEKEFLDFAEKSIDFSKSQSFQNRKSKNEFKQFESTETQKQKRVLPKKPVSD
ncbi:HEAT repeat domain-containing protein [Leptospira idonii]|uniref:HEAT repeat domain-containing protein n=1 Tax=Leptospira idonii TaxID=1193500 RepID=A0A4R9M2D2_9LEPT|nr:HEAT repeat domain-containing protein [Leptospira idonii]TGN20944.1 HEAT repeat domain-containing protein [Leptospira idonii]